MQWKLQSGMFGAGQSLVLEAGSPLQQGDVVSMDFGPSKLDSALLLDYGVLDADQPQVRAFNPMSSVWNDMACPGLQACGIVDGGGGALAYLCSKWLEHNGSTLRPEQVLHDPSDDQASGLHPVMSTG